MSRVNGCLVACDRCGESVFLKTIGDGEADGGFTRWNKFESLPKGWGSDYSVGTLCPTCNQKWKSLKEDFLKAQNEFMRGDT